MRLVIILGAGASAPFGVPTLRYIFQDLQARNYLAADQGLNTTLHNVFWNPRGLNLETSDRGLTIEEILTITRDYQAKKFEAPDLDIGDVNHFRKALYLLSKSAVYEGKSSRGAFLNPLINWSRQNFEHTTWGSFNWDCLFESSYYYNSGRPGEYRNNPSLAIDIDNWVQTYSSTLFLKLHGGVNWWFENGRLRYLPFGGGELNQYWDAYRRGAGNGHPVLLEPSFYKYEDPVYAQLKVQWDRFVKELLQADVVVVIGYSLPEADPEARRALTIAFQGNSDARFIVFDSSDWVRERYQRIYGNVRLRTIGTPYHELGHNIGEVIMEKIREIDGR